MLTGNTFQCYINLVLGHPLRCWHWHWSQAPWGVLHSVPRCPLLSSDKMEHQPEQLEICHFNLTSQAEKRRPHTPPHMDCCQMNAGPSPTLCWHGMARQLPAPSPCLSWYQHTPLRQRPANTVPCSDLWAMRNCLTCGSSRQLEQGKLIWWRKVSKKHT